MIPPIRLFSHWSIPLINYGGVQERHRGGGPAVSPEPRGTQAHTGAHAHRQNYQGSHDCVGYYKRNTEHVKVLKSTICCTVHDSTALSGLKAL
jgi:hypothetical protein